MSVNVEIISDKKKYVQKSEIEKLRAITKSKKSSWLETKNVNRSGLIKEFLELLIGFRKRKSRTINQKFITSKYAKKFC